MIYTVQCREPEALPAEVQLGVECADNLPGKFAVYLLPSVEALADQTPSIHERGLRRTILRPTESKDPRAKLPPSGSSLIAEFNIRIGKPEDRAAEPEDRTAKLYFVTVGEGDELTSIVVESTRERLRPGPLGSQSVALPNPVTLRLELSTGGTIQIELILVEALALGAEFAFGGGRPNLRLAADGALAAYWIIPTVSGLLQEPKARALAALHRLSSRLGMSPWVFSMLIIGISTVGGTAWLAWQEHQAADLARESASSAEEKMAAAIRGANVAFAAERRCRDDLLAASSKLRDGEAIRTSAVEGAMAVSLARSRASAPAGDELGEMKRGVEIDKEYVTSLRSAVMSALTPLDAVAGEPDRCLEQRAALGQDLPEYVLAWSPSPDVVCSAPEARSETGGVSRFGRWQLSKRALVTAQLRDGAGQDDWMDQSQNDRWSAQVVVEGVRAVSETIGQRASWERPVVAPGQLHVWSLALWDAYNQMPDGSEMSVPPGVSECVSQLINILEENAGPTDPASPILPDLASVAATGELGALRAGVDCTWTPHSIQAGAKRAIAAIALVAEREIDAKAPKNSPVKW